MFRLAAETSRLAAYAPQSEKIVCARRGKSELSTASLRPDWRYTRDAHATRNDQRSEIRSQRTEGNRFSVIGSPLIGRIKTFDLTSCGRMFFGGPVDQWRCRVCRA